MKKVLFSVGIVFLLSLAAFAQGPFADVPTDHWAYDAVNELQQAGIVIGYPDGTFGGRRAMTRYEFAVAIARAIPIIEERILGRVPAAQGGVSQDQFNALEQRVRNLENKPAAEGGVTRQEFQNLQNLVNEFRDDLAALGVDVDALKRDVAALAARVDAIEKEMQRVKWNGTANVFGVATSQDTGLPFGKDGRPFQTPGVAGGDLINSVSVVRDMDLNLVGGLTPGLSVVSDINYGNYIPAYLGGIVTDYIGTERNAAVTGADDQFIPYYLYLQAGFGAGNLTAGRIPVQFTPYTLKLIDVDSYTYNQKTDSGDYPLDGAKLVWKFGGVGLTAFAAKTDENPRLGAGLIAQPTIGLYDDNAITPVPGGGTTFYTTPAGALVAGAGHAAGGLVTTTQAAGARLLIGTPFQGNLGLNFIQAVGPIAGYDTVDIMGADGRWQLGRFGLAAEFAQTTTTDDDGVLPDIDDNNTAIDAKLGFGLGKLGIDLGWKSIENNFGAPGYWGKIGMWTNPTNVEGPFADFTYGITPSVSLVANAALLSGANDVAALPAVMNSTDDDLNWFNVGLKWGITTTNSIQLGWERAQWSPDEVGADDSNEDYITIGWGYQFNPSAGMNISYQIVDYDASGTTVPYGPDYKGAIAVAQFQAKF